MELTVNILELGDIYDKLSNMNPELKINLSSPHSYRGYYVDLALEPKPTIVEILLSELDKILEEGDEGYKGGHYSYYPDSIVWVAHYGSTSNYQILDLIERDDHVEVVTQFVQY